MPSIYIIILNWNGYEDTIACVESLQQLSYQNYRIVLIDNGSTNDSVNILKQTFPGITLIENKENRGYAGGCNAGLHYALQNDADYILFLNNDTIVDKNLLVELVRAAEKDNRIAVVGPKIYYADRPNVIWFTGAMKANDRILRFKAFDNNRIDNEEVGSVKEVDCFWGCCMMVKREALEKAGAFDERLFLYLEDIDFCIRIKQEGYKILFVPQAKIWHKVSGSSGGEGSVRQCFYNARNYLHLAKKHLSKKQRMAFYRQYFLDKIQEIGVLLKERKYGKARAIAKGLYHGIRNKTGNAYV